MAREWKRFARHGRNTRDSNNYQVQSTAAGWSRALPAIASLLPAGRLQISWVAAAGRVGPLPVVSSLGPLPVSREEALHGLRRRGEDGPTPARTRTLLVRVRVRVRVGVRVGVGVGVGGLGLSFRLRVGIRVRVRGGVGVRVRANLGREQAEALLRLDETELRHTPLELDRHHEAAHMHTYIDGLDMRVRVRLARVGLGVGVGVGVGIGVGVRVVRLGVGLGHT